MTEKVFVRFAPSPTGWLHVGNMRTALINWLYAKQHGGRFLLRVDDTDLARSKPEYESGLKEDLQWLGLEWDETVKQSERFAQYDLAKQQLIDAGRLYACYETAEEIDIKRKMQISRGAPPVYDRSALTLTQAQIAAYESEGRKPHYRFKMDAAPIQWHDLIRGEVKFDGSLISDPVLFREDGVALFTLSTSVDDGQMGITHIMRGEDHVSNTAVQVQIMEALGHKIPMFGHMALLKMKEGKISKREGGGDIRSLRESGVFAMVLASYLAKIGTSDAIELFASMDALVAAFGIGKMGRAMANYDEAEVARQNQKLLHQLPFSDVKAQLSGMGMADVSEAFWEQVKPNLSALSDITAWWEVTQNALTPVITDAEYTRIAAGLLPVGEWQKESWSQFIEALKAATGRKGKELFMPLRLALTGREDGPELPVVVSLIGRERAVKRLCGESA